MNNELSLQMPGTFNLKVGKKVSSVELETAIVFGGRQVLEQMASAAVELAIKKAGNGYYKAAVEMMAFGVTASTIKALAPAEGKGWTKGSTLVLAEKVLERPAGAKGFTAKQLEARGVARRILELLGDKKPGEVVANASEVKAPADDTLAGIEEAPL